MRASVILIHPLYIPAPEPAEHIHQASCGHAVLIVRPHIIIPLVPSVLILPHGNGKIHGQRLQHQLVWPRGIWISDYDLSAGRRRADAVGNDPVARKITSADDIPRPGCRHRRMAVRKK